MATCTMTGKRGLRGNNVSHANNRTIKWQYPNVQSKRIWVEELGKFVRLNVSTRAIRTISKIGLVAFARKQGIDLASLVCRD